MDSLNTDFVLCLSVRCFPKRAMEDDKRSKSLMTTSGMKTFRVLQPTVNNNALTKVHSHLAWVMNGQFSNSDRHLSNMDTSLIWTHL